MAHVEHINNTLKKVSRFLEPLLPLVGCHMVEFFTMNHWETLVPPKMQQDLLDLPQEKLQYIPSASVEFDVTDTDLETWCLHTSNLSAFQMAIKQHSLPALGVTSTVEQVINEAGAELMDSVTMKGVMSDKKSHEVEIMSHVVAQLARGCGIDWIVDVGSGRGYLGSSLVLQYGMNVVAIDSSKTNTASGLVRNSRIQRHWVNLKQAEQDRKEGRYVKKGKKRRVKNSQAQDLQKVDHYLELKTDHQSSQLSVPCGRYIGVTRFVTEDMDLASLISNVVDSENEICNRSSESEISCETKDDSGLDDTNVATVCSSKSSLNASSLELNTTLSKLETTGRYTIQSPQRTGNLLNRDAANSDRNIGASTHASPVKLQEKPRHINLALVGLHTCGNLAASSVRLFLVNPAVALLCNVGCCYHLIEEEYAKNTYNYRKVIKNSYSLEVLPVSSSSSSEMVNYEPDCVHSELSIPSCNSECINVSCTSTVANQDICEQHALTSAQSCVCERKGDEEKSKREIYRKENKGRKIDSHKEKGSVRDCDANLDPLHPSEIPDHGYGFPLSSVLRESKFVLGRNTRMLSCQPADRFTQQNFTRTEALYWRALLQVVLMDKLGEDRSDIGHVGRLSAKCNTFTEYATMAIDKLGLPIQVSEDELNNYLEQYQDARRRLELFFLLRASVAPVIEGLIILDRLAFLREQDATISSHLVQLFDPVISPRCHALLALRSTHSS